MIDWDVPNRFRWFYVVHIRGVAGLEFCYDSNIERRRIAELAIRDRLRKVNRPIWQMCQDGQAGVTITGRLTIA